jgi:membrane-associated phospholipid phosphatase
MAVRALETALLTRVRPDDRSGRRAAAAVSEAARQGRLWAGLSILGATDTRTRRAARDGMIGWVATSGVALVVKELTDRRRPPGIGASGSSPRSSSMPSSHTAAAVAYAAAASLATPRAGLVVWPLAGAVGWSRAATGRHFPSDVIAGAGLGAAIGVAVHLAARRAGWDRADSKANPRRDEEQRTTGLVSAGGDYGPASLA